MLRTHRGTAEETGLRRPVARCAHTPRVCVPGEGSRRPSCRRCFPSCFPAAVSPSAASSGPHLPVWLGAHSRTAAACRAALRGPPRPAARALGHLRPLSAEAFGQRLSSPACGFSFPGGAPHADSNGRVVYFSERGVVSLMSPTGGCLQVTILARTIPKVAAKKPATFLRLMAHRTCARRAR